MITIRWCAGFLFFLALIPAFLGVRDWFLAAFMFAAFVVAFTPWHRLVADLPAGDPEELSRLDRLDGVFIHDHRCISLTGPEWADVCDCRTLRLIDEHQRQEGS